MIGRVTGDRSRAVRFSLYRVAVRRAFRLGFRLVTVNSVESCRVSFLSLSTLYAGLLLRCKSRSGSHRATRAVPAAAQMWGRATTVKRHLGARPRAQSTIGTDY